MRRAAQANLACALLSAVMANSAAAQVSGRDRAWGFAARADPFTDEVTSSATAAGEEGRLGIQIRCIGRKSLAIAFLNQGGLVSTSRGEAATVLIRADSREPVSASGYGRLKAVLFERYVHRDFGLVLEEIAAAKSRLVVRVPALAGYPVTDTFGTKGLDSALKRVQQDCGQASP